MTRQDPLLTYKSALVLDTASFYHSHELLSRIEDANDSALHLTSSEIAVNFYDFSFLPLGKGQENQLPPPVHLPHSPFSLVNNLAIQTQFAEPRRQVSVIATPMIVHPSCKIYGTDLGAIFFYFVRVLIGRIYLFNDYFDIF